MYIKRWVACAFTIAPGGYLWFTFNPINKFSISPLLSVILETAWVRLYTLVFSNTAADMTLIRKVKGHCPLEDVLHILFLQINGKKFLFCVVKMWRKCTLPRLQTNLSHLSTWSLTTCGSTWSSTLRLQNNSCVYLSRDSHLVCTVIQLVICNTLIIYFNSAHFTHC